ncbi:tetratricopeptide repeat protein [Leucobacter chromiiresistens]
MTSPAPDWQARVDDAWNDPLSTPAQTVARIAALAAELPHDDPRGAFELGGAYDSAGSEAAAAEQYERAIALGLSGRARAELDIQYASTLRNLGRAEEAVATLEASSGDPALGAARAAFLALALHSAGRPGAGLAVALEAIAPSLPRYQRSVRAYAAELRRGENGGQHDPAAGGDAAEPTGPNP